METFTTSNLFSEKQLNTAAVSQFYVIDKADLAVELLLTLDHVCLSLLHIS